MVRISPKEVKAEILQGKIEIIKTAYPNLFKANNTLTTALNTATAIVSLTPYYFKGETTEIAPFKMFSFKYEPYQTMEQSETMEQSSMKRKWRLHIGFIKAEEGFNSGNNLILLYMGDVDSETQQPQSSNKLFLRFLSTETRVIFDLNNRKIGFTNDSNKKSYRIDDYPTVIDFDQITNLADQENLLSQFNKNSAIKIYGIEVDQERNIVAFRCKDGLFGRTEHNITLPLKMEVKPGESFQSQSIDTFDNQPPSEHPPRKKPVPVDTININDINLKIISGRNSIIITIGNLTISLRELTYLYYKYVKEYDTGQLFEIIKVANTESKLIEIRLIERNILLIAQKEGSTDHSTFRTTPISILVDEAIKSGILNEDFIKKLEEVLAKVKTSAKEKKSVSLNPKVY